MEGSIASGQKINASVRLKSKQPNSLETNIVHIQDCELNSYDIGDYSESLYASDDIVIIGYPQGITDYSMQPLWKRATIATSHIFGWERQDNF